MHLLSDVLIEHVEAEVDPARPAAGRQQLRDGPRAVVADRARREVEREPLDGPSWLPFPGASGALQDRAQRRRPDLVEQ